MSSSTYGDIKVLAKVRYYNSGSELDKVYKTTLDRFLNAFREQFTEYLDPYIVDDLAGAALCCKSICIEEFRDESYFDGCQVNESGAIEVSLNFEFMEGGGFNDFASEFVNAMSLAFDQSFIISRIRYYSLNSVYEDLGCLNCHTTGYTWNDRRCDQCLSVLHNPERFAVVHSIDSGPDNAGWSKNIFFAPKEEDPWEMERDTWYLLTDEILKQVFQRFCGWEETGQYFPDKVFEEDLGHEEVILRLQGQEAERYRVSNIPETRPQPIEFPTKSPHYDGLLPKMKEIIRKSDRCDEFFYHLKLAGDKSLWLGDRSYHLLPPEIENEIMKICGVENWDDLYHQ